jgi:steroid 5-alpha reductase family enzyme
LIKEQAKLLSMRYLFRPRSITLVEAVFFHNMYRSYHVTRRCREERREREIKGSVEPQIAKGVKSYFSIDNFQSSTQTIRSSLSSFQQRLERMSNTVTEKLSNIQRANTQTVEQGQPQSETTSINQTTAERVHTIPALDATNTQNRSIFANLLKIIPITGETPSIIATLIRPLIVIAGVMILCWFYCLHQTGFINADLLHNLRADIILVTTGLYILLQRVSLYQILRSIFSPKRFSSLILYLTKGFLNLNIALLSNLLTVIPKSFRQGIIRMMSFKNVVSENIISLAQRQKIFLSGMMLLWYLLGGGMNKEADPFRIEDELVQHGTFKRVVNENNAFWYKSLTQVFLKQAVEIWTLSLPFFVMAVREIEALPSVSSRGVLFMSHLCSSLGVMLFITGLGLQFAHRVQKQLFESNDESNHLLVDSLFYFINRYKMQVGEEFIWIAFWLVGAACVLAKRQTLLAKAGLIFGSSAAPVCMWKKIANQIDERDRKNFWNMFRYGAIFIAAFIRETSLQLWRLIRAQLITWFSRHEKSI